MTERLFQPGEEHQGSRIDVYLSTAGPYSRNAAQRLIAEGFVTIDGFEARKNSRLRGCERVLVLEREPLPAELLPEAIPLDILFEDDDLLVVHKPRGLCVHPSPGHESGTLVNALLYHLGDRLSGIGGVRRPGIVHRIDKDTSGLLVVAKNDSTHCALSDMLKRHDIQREYEAITRGRMKQDRFTVFAPLGRHRTERKLRAVTADGKAATTHVEVLARYNGYSHILCRLETGRTHQIRAHMKYIGHPLAGDSLYGGKPGELGFDGQALHARRLSFIHPRTAAALSFERDAPELFQRALDTLRG